METKMLTKPFNGILVHQFRTPALMTWAARILASPTHRPGMTAVPVVIAAATGADYHLRHSEPPAWMRRHTSSQRDSGLMPPAAVLSSPETSAKMLSLLKLNTGCRSTLLETGRMTGSRLS